MKRVLYAPDEDQRPFSDCALGFRVQIPRSHFSQRPLTECCGCIAKLGVGKKKKGPVKNVDTR